MPRGVHPGRQLIGESAGLLTMTETEISKAKVFWIVTALVCSVLIFVLLQLIRLSMAIQLSILIESLSLTVSHEYLAVSGAIWTAAGLLSAWLLLRRHPLGPISLKVIAVVYSLNYWVEQVWMTRSPLRSVNWTFSAALNIFVLLVIFSILSHPIVRIIFGDHNGRKPENQ
jgi:hypothetical protein